MGDRTQKKKSEEVCPDNLAGHFVGSERSPREVSESKKEKTNGGKK